MGLVHAFGEQAGESPVRHRLGDLAHDPPTLLPSEVHVGVGIAVELAGTSAANVIGRSSKSRQLIGPVAVDFPPAISGGKLLETVDFRLLEVLPQHPRRVDLGVCQAIGPQHPGDISISVPPMPDRDGQTGEDEVTGVVGAGTGCTGLIKVAKIHGGPGPDGTEKECVWALEPWFRRTSRLATLRRRIEKCSSG